MNSIDDLFVKLRAMTYDEALELAIAESEKLPLGTHSDYKVKFINELLERFGWSYEKLTKDVNIHPEKGMHNGRKQYGRK
jgi:hypothetical protein